jgi:hypothetical protein
MQEARRPCWEPVAYRLQASRGGRSRAVYGVAACLTLVFGASLRPASGPAALRHARSFYAQQAPRPTATIPGVRLPGVVAIPETEGVL